MDFYFLGTGNAFGHGGRRRSHYYWEGSSSLMIDAGYDAMSGLRSIGKNISDVNMIFISHLHPDHCLGLPQFVLEDFYVLKKEEPIEVFGPKGLKNLVIDYIKKFYNPEVLSHMEKLYIFEEVGPDEIKKFEQGKLETFKADHEGNARMQRITLDDVKLGYTGDTGFIPNIFDEMLKADFTITEASSGRNRIPHHTNVLDLLNHDIPKNKFVYLSHVGESTIEMRNEIIRPLILTEDGMKINPKNQKL